MRSRRASSQGNGLIIPALPVHLVMAHEVRRLDLDVQPICPVVGHVHIRAVVIETGMPDKLIGQETSAAMCRV